MSFNNMPRNLPHWTAVRSLMNALQRLSITCRWLHGQGCSTGCLSPMKPRRMDGIAVLVRPQGRGSNRDKDAPTSIAFSTATSGHQSILRPSSARLRSLPSQLPLSDKSDSKQKSSWSLEAPINKLPDRGIVACFYIRPKFWGPRNRRLIASEYNLAKIPSLRTRVYRPWALFICNIPFH
jgi:hypothetical protein